MTSLAVDRTEHGIRSRAEAWGRASDISARSALVTILGDTVAPLGGTVWLADVIALAEPFGFNERLVRTSMFRLAAEGWVASERVGRKSRYSLTEYGREETSAAEQRIYRPRAGVWDGSWTLVFLPTGAGDRPEIDTDDERTDDRDDNGAVVPERAGGADELRRHLRWRGFATMADGVHAHPNDSVAETRRLLDRLGIEPAPPVAAARFDGDGVAPIVGPGFRADSGLAEAEAAYHRFLDRYGDVEVSRAIEPIDAFALRTMLVHDLRRARLRDPDLPSALLADDWVGHRAIALAAQLHRTITGPAWRWVEDLTGLGVVTDDVVAARFTNETNPAPPAMTKGSP